MTGATTVEAHSLATSTLRCIGVATAAVIPPPFHIVYASGSRAPLQVWVCLDVDILFELKELLVDITATKFLYVSFSEFRIAHFIHTFDV